MPHLVNLVTALHERGIGFWSICDGMIDTTTASGELVFHIFSALAQLFRNVPGLTEDHGCRHDVTSEKLRDVTWVIVNEVKSGHWGVGGNALGLEDVRKLISG